MDNEAHTSTHQLGLVLVVSSGAHWMWKGNQSSWPRIITSVRMGGSKVPMILEIIFIAGGTIYYSSTNTPIYVLYCTFLAASWMASGSNTRSPVILEVTISWSCWKVYGWKVSLVKPYEKVEYITPCLCARSLMPFFCCFWVLILS